MSSADSDLWRQWLRLAPDTPESRAVWTDLIERWSQPHRHYHGLGHLVFVLAFIDEWSPEAPPETLLGAWFHDAVYDPRSSTNETDSAELAASTLPRIGCAELADDVRRIIVSTIDHRDPADRATAILLDADLAILGQDPAVYLRYVEAVRREYAHLTDAEFLAGRQSLMKGFAERDRIYTDEDVHLALDAAARRNIAAELAVYAGRAGA